MKASLNHADGADPRASRKSPKRSRQGFCIRAALAHEIIAFAAEETGYRIAYAGEVPIALAGIARVNGVLWAAFQVKPGAERYGVQLVRALRRGLCAVGEPVYVQRASENAERLLRVLGFAPTGETMNDLEVWKCPA